MIPEDTLLPELESSDELLQVFLGLLCGCLSCVLLGLLPYTQLRDLLTKIFPNPNPELSGSLLVLILLLPK